MNVSSDVSASRDDGNDARADASDWFIFFHSIRDAHRVGAVGRCARAGVDSFQLESETPPASRNI
jgi:hypothetical protein